MKNFLKKFIPKVVLCAYHYCLARLASVYYRNPSGKMIVIGVTGTNGKTTTARFIAEALGAAGKKVGLATTAEFQIGDRRWLNDMKMTMPGRLYLQKLLQDMVVSECEYAIIETSSQGIIQFRHIGIHYDVIVFTNLTPEHIEAHGGFENYKKAKGKLFEHLASMKKKRLDGKEIDRVSIVNLDDQYASYFLQFGADKKYGFTLQSHYDIKGIEEVRVEFVSVSPNSSKFVFLGQPVEIAMPGKHNIYNAIAALTVGFALGCDIKDMEHGLRNVSVPGRMEYIQEGQKFSVIIDYAPEPEGLKQLYTTLELVKKNKIIHVLGSCGGGRDLARRPIVGEIAGKNANFVIITNEDPYDDNPQEIIDQVATGALGLGKIENKDLFKILDRRLAIRKAFELAQENDLVIITGKGCEQAIVVKNNKKIPWDDRAVAREELKKFKVQNSKFKI